MSCDLFRVLGLGHILKTFWELNKHKISTLAPYNIVLSSQTAISLIISLKAHHGSCYIKRFYNFQFFLTAELLICWQILGLSCSKPYISIISQRCQPSLFQGEASYFFGHFCPFWHPNLATVLFVASFVQLKLHVVMKTFLFFVWILPIFWMLMFASLIMNKNIKKKKKKKGKKQIASNS